mmetsp:Transcript_34638/g.111577  ORF Transcript_34638/g.111577 Transcript_34638/m.111577 type:complete len:229 (+) Transcript_34638:39-725(+)
MGSRRHPAPLRRADGEWRRPCAQPDRRLPHERGVPAHALQPVARGFCAAASHHPRGAAAGRDAAARGQAARGGSDPRRPSGRALRPAARARARRRGCGDSWGGDLEPRQRLDGPPLAGRMAELPLRHRRQARNRARARRRRPLRRLSARRRRARGLLRGRGAAGHAARRRDSRAVRRALLDGGGGGVLGRVPAGPCGAAPPPARRRGEGGGRACRRLATAARGGAAAV